MIHGQARVANVVLDIGSYHTFAGQAGLESPRFASYSYLVENHSHKKQQYYAGSQALNSQNFDKQIHSIFQDVGPNGKVQKFQFDINRLDKFVETILMDNLELDNCNISLLICEDVATDLYPNEILKQRQKIADYLLEGMELSNIAFVKKPILTTFGVGRSSGVVLDSGHSFSHCSVVQDGFCVYNKSLKFGGSMIHNMVRSQIQNQVKKKPWKIAMQNSAEAFKPSDVQFHKLVEISNIINKFTSISLKSTMLPQNIQVSYTLPDNQTIKINRVDIVDPFINYKRFYSKQMKKISQGLSSYIDQSFYKVLPSYRGLEQLVYSTIQQYLGNLDQKSRTIVPSSHHLNGIQANRKRAHQITQQELLNNVILTGGNLNFSDLAWNIDRGIRNKGGSTVENALNFQKQDSTVNPTRSNSTSWVGGSILCNLPVFNHFWIKLSEWKQIGATLTSSKAVGPEIIKSSQPTESQQYLKRNKKLQILSKKSP